MPSVSEPEPAVQLGPRERLLAAALEALAELDATALLNAVGVREIAQRAGVSTSAVYHYYGSLTALADAVVDHVFDPGTDPVGRMIDLMVDLTTERFPLLPSIQAHASELSRVTHDTQFSIRMGLWALGGPRATDAYRDYTRALNGRLTASLEALYRQWGREPRPPFDVAGVVNAVDAFTNGTVLRQLVDPDPARVMQYPRACIAMTTTLLRVFGDQHNTDDRLVEMNHFPLDRRRGVSAATEARTAATRSRILYAAGELFASSGYEGTTVAQIARRADTSTTTVHSLYRSKHGVAVALVRAEAHDLLTTLAD
ncbi:MAG: TetR family transcriptional regulator, partial [Actinobacteria bacterium]|nr:TetR family transcriptional regulator [Actinomycetota bacterium]